MLVGNRIMMMKALNKEIHESRREYLRRGQLIIVLERTDWRERERQKERQIYRDTESNNRWSIVRSYVYIWED